MTRLIWNNDDKVKYESGINRGVLYLPGESGVPWNGLISIDEQSIGGERTSYHFDGIKYLDIVAAKDFQASLKSISYPVEFRPCLGEKAVFPGMFLTRQPRSLFGLSYRHEISDTDYKIHLIYNITASPESKSYSTNTENVSVSNFGCRLDSVPIIGYNYRPSSHYIIDSTLTDPSLLDIIEDQLYGTDSTDPLLLTPEDVLTIINNHLITDPILEPI